MPDLSDNHARVGLALIVLVTFGAFVFATVFGHSSADSTVIGMGLGYLAANASAVVSFYFGSSSGSVKKDDIIAQKTDGLGSQVSGSH